MNVNNAAQGRPSDVRGLPGGPADLAELRDRVAAFIRERVTPSETLLDAGGPEARAQLRKLQLEAGEAGLWAAPLPVELGGQGLTLSR
ncbi:acyl-CoA dehydrogenase family protein [Streptomyces sp. NPDC054933]